MSSATYSSTGPSTPLGVKIICILGAIGGVLGLFGSLVLLGMSPVLGIFSLVVSLVQLIVVVGLWNLRSWAWTLAMIAYGLGILLDLVALDVFGLGIGLVILGYLGSKRYLFR